MGKSTRRSGAEWRAALWLARHPGAVMLPGSVAAGVVEWGGPATGGLAAGLLAGTAAWYRAHPSSFDTVAAPRLRSVRRRWLSRAYCGPWWRDALLSCDLASTHRKTGEIRYPRILRVRSVSPTIDTVHVRLVPGQHVKQWETQCEALAEALRVERVAVERIRPQVIGLVVQRTEPFDEVIDAPDMPWDSDAVDLSALYLGETEYGADWTESLIGQHWLVAGAMGSGKNSLSWSPLRDLAPMIRDGMVRPWLVDPKRMELSAAEPIAYRYAAEPDDCAALVGDYVAAMEDTQRALASARVRKFTPTRETPLNLLMMDELGALMAYGDHAREFRKLLALVGSQGRAAGYAMVGYVQEPSKDVVPIRDLFTTRICLRATSAAHVDMVLGDGARLRGALADEIPNDPTTAGIGYVIRQRSRVPMRVRAAYVNDHEVTDLVTFIRNGNNSLKVVA